MQALTQLSFLKTREQGFFGLFGGPLYLRYKDFKMAAKVDQTAAEKSHNQSTASPATTPVRIANSSKVTMRAVKAGVSFVIPKNKLSGAMVPVGRGGGKLETNDSKKDEEVKQPQRKTKWGIDLTQDAAVKRGRALAYQTRVEQISVLLESGNLEIDDDEATRSPSPPRKYDSSGQRTNSREARKREQLDLERREAIGECMRLNPNYKPPPGYKPVNKEAKIYIPVEYPGYNFVGLILGPEGNTQKRLEEETGTKITIKGGMGDAKEAKMQTVDLDEQKVGTVNEDLHVHISADTYEKIDAAIALLDLLMTPVDGNITTGAANTNLLFGDTSKVLDQGAQVADTGYSMLNSDLGQRQTQPAMIPSPGQHLGWPSSAFGTEASGINFQARPGHWHSMGANNSAIQAQHGFPGAPGSSYAINNANTGFNFPRFPPPALNSFHPFPYFRGRPPAPGFNPHAMSPNPRNPMVGPVNRYQPPLYSQQRPFGQEMASQNQSAVMNYATGPGPGPGPQHMMGGVSQPARPRVSLPANPAHHTGSNVPPLPPSPNITHGGGYGPPAPHGGEFARAPLQSPFPSGFPSAVPSQMAASQLPGGAYHQELQSSRPPTPVSHVGPSIQVPLPRWSSSPPQGACAVVPPPIASPVLPSPALSSTAPQGAHTAVPPPAASPVLPSPGLPSTAPQGAHAAVPPPVASPVLPSPGLSSAALQGAHSIVQPPVASPVPLAVPHSVQVAVPPPVGAPMPPPPRLSPAPPQTAPPQTAPPLAGPPSFPRPAMPLTGNVLNVQHPRAAFISQSSSVGLSPVARPSVISPISTPASSNPSGTIPSPIANTPGPPVAVMQSGAVSRPIPQPASATTANITSQGSSVPSSVAPNSWQPQHLSSGDFTFQPLRSQAPPPPQPAWPQVSQPPLPPDVRPQNPKTVTRPGFQPAVPNLPHPLSGPLKVNIPPPPASISVPPPAPPMPPLPPQAPSFRPAASIPSPPRGFSSQSMFSIPSHVSGSQTTTAISPPGPFLVSSQPLPQRPPPGVLNSPVINPFSSSPSQAIPPPLHQPRLQPGTGNLLPFPPLPSAPNVKTQEVQVSQAYQHPSHPNVQIQAPASQAFQHPAHSNASISPGGPLPTSQSNVMMGTSTAGLPGEDSKQVTGPNFMQQQNSPALLHNMSSTRPTSNAQHNHMSASPQIQLPSNPQMQSIIPGQNQAKAVSFSGMHDFGYGGSSNTLAISKEGSSSQSYDPFSPTSIPSEQLQHNQNSSLPPKTDDTHDRQETDAEYENLMESVGVR